MWRRDGKRKIVVYTPIMYGMHNLAASLLTTTLDAYAGYCCEYSSHLHPCKRPYILHEFEHICHGVHHPWQTRGEFA
jgi:hypothetical protein